MAKLPDVSQLSWRAWFQIMRLPMLFTVPGDALCGYCVCSGELSVRKALASVLICLALSFFATLLDDFHDVRSDLHEHPERPLPSRQISLRSVRILLYILPILILLMASLTSLALFICAAVLLLLTFLSKTYLSPYRVIDSVLTAFIRMGYILCGVFAGTNIRPESYALLLFVLFGHFFYFYGLSRLSREETFARVARFGRMALLIGSAVPLGLFTYLVSMPKFELTLSTGLFLLMNILVFFLGFRTFLVLAAPFRSLRDIQLQLLHLLAGLIFIQGAWICVSNFPNAVYYALGIWILFIPFKILTLMERRRECLPSV